MSKKDLILDCVSVGMDAKRAYYIAELTQEEMDELDNDPDFKRLVSAKEATVEYDLLKKLDQVIEKNILKGNSKELRFKLGAINSKWRNVGGGATPQAGTINIFTKDYNPESEDTVEIHTKEVDPRLSDPGVS